MAETWTCPVCSTVNEEVRESCMVCGTDKSDIAPVERPASEAPPGIILPEELLPPPPTPWRPPTPGPPPTPGRCRRRRSPLGRLQSGRRHRSHAPLDRHRSWSASRGRAVPPLAWCWGLVISGCSSGVCIPSDRDRRGPVGAETGLLRYREHSSLASRPDHSPGDRIARHLAFVRYEMALPATCCGVPCHAPGYTYAWPAVVGYSHSGGPLRRTYRNSRIAGFRRRLAASAPHAHRVMLRSGEDTPEPRV